MKKKRISLLKRIRLYYTRKYLYSFAYYYYYTRAVPVKYELLCACIHWPEVYNISTYIEIEVAVPYIIIYSVQEYYNIVYLYDGRANNNDQCNPPTDLKCWF